MLGFALLLFIGKVILMSLIPDAAGWVTTKLLATKYQLDKLHEHEMTSAQASDAIAVERVYVQQNMEKLKFGVQADREQALQQKKNN
jgi:hypothetical protein